MWVFYFWGKNTPSKRQIVATSLIGPLVPELAHCTSHRTGGEDRYSDSTALRKEVIP
jgi:hypothetical protein